MQIEATMDCPFECFEGKGKLINITTKGTTYQCQKCKEMWSNATSDV